MSTARSFSLGIVSLAVIAFSGCVGPMAHGPLGGCCGPCVASNDSACTGCGELYVDPWLNHPADCVDPCDTCGNYNGQSCGKCRPMFEGIWSLWGYRCGDDCGDCAGPICVTPRRRLLGGLGCAGGACDSGACDSGICGGGECSCGVEVIEPSCGMSPCTAGCCDSDESSTMLYDNGTTEFIDQGDYIIGELPTPAQEGIISTHQTRQPYQPERTRKIFNPRPRVATGSGRSIGY